MVEVIMVMSVLFGASLGRGIFLMCRFLWGFFLLVGSFLNMLILFLCMVMVWYVLGSGSVLNCFGVVFLVMMVFRICCEVLFMLVFWGLVDGGLWLVLVWVGLRLLISYLVWEV